MKGMVLEKLKRDIVVLTPDGRFIKLRNINGAEVGEEYEFDEAGGKTGFLYGAKRYAALAASLVFMVCAGYASYWYNTALTTVYEYVSIDINPSVELGVNRFDTVITTEYLNEDAENMLKEVDLNKLKIEEAIAIVTEQAVNKGFIAEDNENNILITASNDNVAEKPAKIEKLAETSKKVIEKKNLKAEVEAVKTEKKARDRARELGLSAGKYLLYKEAISQGLNVNTEDVRNKSVNKAIKEAGGNYADIVRKAKEKAAEQMKANITQKQTQQKILRNEEKKENVKENEGKKQNTNNKNTGIDSFWRSPMENFGEINGKTVPDRKDKTIQNKNETIENKMFEKRDEIKDAKDTAKESKKESIKGQIREKSGDIFKGKEEDIRKRTIEDAKEEVNKNLKDKLKSQDITKERIRQDFMNSFQNKGKDRRR